PIGTGRYARPDLEVELEAFSPFVPTELEDSSLPATMLAFRVTNRGSEELTVTLRGTLQNMVGLASEDGITPLVRRTRALSAETHQGVEHFAELELAASERADIVFEDFEREAYDGWTVEGSAFGAGPVAEAELPDYQGRVGAEGARLANSHHTRGGEDIPAGDAHVGTLTSREFVLERGWITLLLGGGAHAAGTGVELLIDGEVAYALTGRNENRLRPVSIPVHAWAGQKARLRIFDRISGGWGNVGVDSIVFSDRPRVEPLEQRGDIGTLALGALGSAQEVELGLPAGEFEDLGVDESASVARRLVLAPGASGEALFVLAWHFPTPWRESLAMLAGIEAKKRHYAARFADAGAVLAHVAARADELGAQTRRWRDTWYDSSLPYWFLDRTFANNSTLATSVCHRFDDGRFYGWEGVYCCAGTCAHVWQYAQGPARLFPALERDQRERVDFGLAFRDDSGQIDYRAEAARELAIDGQAGTILRAYREHTMAADDAFLRRIWPRVKKALGLLLARDPDQDGILDGAQYNTLDTAWWGKIAWTSSLYLAAVRAGEAMAEELGDSEFAARCRLVRERGASQLVRELFNGEYFVHELDPAHPESNSTGDGCHIDQVFGQSWAHQVGLGRILPEAETRSALHALWKYSFAPDIGPYRKYMEDKIGGGRWYALPGEAGLLMCTWPQGGEQSAVGQGQDAWAVGYFNECMSGFEYQVAAHMLCEGLVTEGLAL
ncbi:MAG: GH116 family glycosyl hydrolase, partial [Planctomycetota bacterium]